MIGCNSTDFMFPMMADIFHPIVEQTPGYGTISKTWVLDRTAVCSFTPAGSSAKEEIVPNVDLTQSSLLVGRVKEDIRVSSRENPNSLTNVLISNIKDANGNQIYVETSGPRKGKATIFEVATQQPFTGPFGGSVEYYKVVLRRSENQAVDL
jgi:hypothetical protein